MLQAWNNYDLPKPSKKPAKKTSFPVVETMTEQDLMRELEKLPPNKRAQVIRNNKGLAEIYIYNKLRERRAEETEHSRQEHEDAISRYKRTEKLEVEKLSKAKEAEEGLRDILKKWIEEKQTR